MLHYTNMPIKEWWEHPKNKSAKHPRISEFEEKTAERYRLEFEANETKRMMEVYNDIRFVS
jgi:hypothetical protein